MIEITDRPLLLFVIAVCILWLSAHLGSVLRKRYALDEEMRQDFGILLASAMTLFALILGFTFSMAANRYDQRKNFEEAEANAIGTEYLRAALLPSTDATKVRTLLKRYLDQRILSYSAQDEQRVRRFDAATIQLQADLWSAVLAPAAAQPTAVVVLVVSGMNDVFNAQGFTQAAWWYRIPAAAWAMNAVIAICCNFMLGYGRRSARAGTRLFLIFPILVAFAFAFTADIDSPRHGVIRLLPQNLVALSQSLPPP